MIVTRVLSYHYNHKHYKSMPLLPFLFLILTF